MTVKLYRIFFYLFILNSVSAFSQSDSIDIKLLNCKTSIQKAELLAKTASDAAGKNVDQSNLYAKQALVELGTIKTSTAAKTACSIYRTLAINYYYNGNSDSSISACENALLLAKKLKDSKEIADAYLCMQTAYREMGKYDKAVEVSSIALKYYEEDKDLKGQARATLNI